MNLAAGDRVLFYTDGLVEAHNPGGEMFGGPRLQRLVQEFPSPTGLIEGLLGELQAFAGAAWEQEDDVTLVVLRRDGGG